VDDGGGTITTSGVYTAPTVAGTYHVKAVSVADPTKSATATVIVNSAPKPFPLGTWVGPNNFKFTVTSLIVDSSTGVKQYSGTVYYPSLPGGSMYVNGTDTLFQIMAGIFPSINSASLSVSGIKMETDLSYTSFAIGLNGSPQSNNMTGTMTITCSNPAYNYLNMSVSFTKQ
jgi:hypothetical protein